MCKAVNKATFLWKSTPSKNQCHTNQPTSVKSNAIKNCKKKTWSHMFLAADPRTHRTCLVSLYMFAIWQIEKSPVTPCTQRSALKARAVATEPSSGAMAKALGTITVGSNRKCCSSGTNLTHGLSMFSWFCSHARHLHSTSAEVWQWRWLACELFPYAG